MGREIVLFKSEERRSRGEVAAFLHQLADKLVENTVVLRRDEEELVLTVPSQVVLELKVEEEQKKQGLVKHSLEIEIEWAEGDDAPGPVTLA